MDSDTTVPDAGTSVETTDTSSGLDENVAGALSYLLGIVTGLVFFVVEKDNQFVRFHAAQSIAVFGLVFVASVVLGFVGTAVSALVVSGSTGAFLVGSLVSLVLLLAWSVVGLATFALWLYLMFRAYQGKTPRIPIAASIADRLV
ncbi:MULTISPECIES: DUF4870 domain-containing protein [Salinibaculum]|uniref:DUF4870 domain-containing protein n=1 Tax=Salinibaculum TaxID=2732368 RepID=UPI0030CAB50C